MRTVHRVVNPDKAPAMFNGRCALALMTKAPRAGQVKTRLVPPLTPEEAAQLNRCFLQDTATAISVCCGCAQRLLNPSRAAASGIAVYTPAGAESLYADILPSDFSFLLQRGEKFGERLYFAAEDLFKCGFGAVCLIDSDSPTIPADNFIRAVELLLSPKDRIVLGPCDDGGYYLIGLKQLHPEIFEEIDWSTDRVFEQTKQRAKQIGVEARFLPPGFDVDDRAALHRLCDELLGSTTDAAPRTRKFLSDIVAREGRDRIWPE
jgi:rSAM/selenodomain-associated transferase 1